MQLAVKLPSLYQWQRSIIGSPKRHRLVIVSRQAGKTTLAQYEAIQTILRGKKVLWCAPVHSQVEEIFRSVLETLPAKLVKKIKTPFNIELITGGRIFFRSTDRPANLRGQNYHLVVADEFAFGQEDVWPVIRPTLAGQVQGRFLGISSPNGHNFVYDLFQSKKDSPQWECLQLPWTCSPNLRPEEIHEAEKEMSRAAFRQEFLAEFVSPGGAIFDGEWLADIFVESMPKSPQRTGMAVDLSLGKITSDWQSVVYGAWHDDTLYVDCSVMRLPIAQLNLRVKEIYEQYRPEWIAYESNGWQQLAADDFLRLFAIPPCVMMLQNNVEKRVRISRLSTLLARGRLKILNNHGGKQLWNQLADFPVGKFDDAPDAVEMLWRTMVETTR